MLRERKKRVRVHVCVLCVCVHVQAAARTSGAHTSESDMALVRVIADKFNSFISEVRCTHTHTHTHAQGHRNIISAWCAHGAQDKLHVCKCVRVGVGVGGCVSLLQAEDSCRSRCLEVGHTAMQLHTHTHARNTAPKGIDIDIELHVVSPVRCTGSHVDHTLCDMEPPHQEQQEPALRA